MTRAIVLAHRMALEGGDVLGQASVTAVRQTVELLIANGVHELCLVDGEHAQVLANRLELDGLGIETRVVANRSWRHASGSAL